MKLFKKTNLTFSVVFRGTGGTAIFKKDMDDEFAAAEEGEAHPSFHSRWPTGTASIRPGGYICTKNSRRCSKQKDFQSTYDELVTHVATFKEQSNLDSMKITVRGVKKDVQVDVTFKSLEDFRQYLESNKLLKVDNAKRMTFTL